MAEAQNGYISRGNMTIILSSAGLIMIAFGAFVTQQNNAIDRQITRIDATLDHTLRKDEHEEFKLRIDKDITRMQALIVPRPENETKWNANEKDIKVLQERINDLRNITAGTYTVRDEMQRLQQELTDMRKLLADRKTSP